MSGGQKFLIACRPSADETELLAGQTLKKILEEQNKKVFFWPSLPAEFAQKFSAILPAVRNSDLPQKIKIKIPKNIAIEEMRYEEGNDFFNIIVSPKSWLEPSNLSIEKAPHETDGAFCFAEDQTFLEKINAPVIKPAKDKIIYVARNERFLSEKIADICAIWGQPSKETATLILGILILETENMQRAKPGVFTLANQLLLNQADYEKITEIINKEKSLERARLFGRALARTTVDRALKTAWTFLKAEDFEKTKLAPAQANILSILKRLRLAIEEQILYVICYQTEKIQTVFWSQNQQLLENLAGRFGGHPESFYFFGPQFENFSEAETKIRNLLRE